MNGPDVTSLLQDLLRIDTSNPGSTEEAAATFVADFLDARGVSNEVVEAAPGRCSVVSRMHGANPDAPALLVHSHLDVVPPQSSGWTHDPFGGVEADGHIWGRGALDMKAFVAMMLAAQDLIASGLPIRRDIVFIYFADEEMGGTLGSQWLAANRPELFDGITEGIGEIGGFAVPLGRTTLYPVQVAEKGMLWLRVSIPGIAGHAAYPVRSNPLERLGSLLGRIASLRIDEAPLEASAQFRESIAAAIPGGADAAAQALGNFGEFAAHGERTTFVPTAVAAGGKTNVVPDIASVTIDCRPLPGSADAALAKVAELLDPDMTLEVLQRGDGLAAPLATPMFASFERAVAAHDPDAIVVPYVMPAGTDAQRIAPLGIAGYGFAPLALPAGFDYLGLFHAPDERVPVAAVHGGWEIFRAFLEAA